MTEPKKRFRPIYFIRKLLTKHIWFIWMLVIAMFLTGIICGLVGYSAFDWLSPEYGHDQSQTVDPSTYGMAYLVNNTVYNDYDDSITYPVNPLDSVYATLKLFKLDDHTFTSPNILVSIARFLLPLSIGFAIILAFFKFLRKSYHRTRSFFFRNHTIVCGLGIRGSVFVKDAIARYNRKERKSLDILVIEKNPDDPMIKFCQDEGITVFVGDACNADTLALTRPWAAKDLFSFIPGDGQNVALANTVAEVFLNEKMKKDGKLSCHLSLSNITLQHQFMDREFTFTDGNHHTMKEFPIDVDLRFSTEALSERALITGVTGMFLKLPVFQDLEPGDAATIAVIGGGYIGKEIIANIARLGHMENEVKVTNGIATYYTPMKLFVYDRDPNAEEDLYTAYPILRKTHPLDGISPIPVSAKGELDAIRAYFAKHGYHPDDVKLPLPEIEYRIANFEQTHAVAELARQIYTELHADAVIIALGNDSLSVSTALLLEQLFDSYIKRGIAGTRPLISVYYDRFSGFDAMFGNGKTDYLGLEAIRKKPVYAASGTPTAVLPFCDWSKVSFDVDAAADQVDRIAAGLNSCYSRHFDTDGRILSEHDVRESAISLKLLNIANIEQELASFKDLPVIQIYQNRDHVLHNRMKMSMLGYRIIAATDPIPDGYEPTDPTYHADDVADLFTPNELKELDNLNEWREVVVDLRRNAEIFSRIEHQRWWAEHLMGGWHFSEQREDALKFHPDMLPFECLHDIPAENWDKPQYPGEFSGYQALDFYMVQEMVLAFMDAGFRPVKRSMPAHT